MGQIPRLRAAHAELFLEAASGLVGDVLVERTGERSSLEDAFHGAMLESAEARGVGERGIEIVRLEASTQEQDAARLVPADARWARAQ